MKLIKGKKVKIVDISKFSKVSKELENVNTIMRGYCGETATIVEVDCCGNVCKLNIDNKLYWWNKEYLTRVLKPKIKKMWAAMDDNGKVYLSSLKPKLDKNLGMFLVNNKDSEYSYIGCDSIAKTLLPNLTYENSPQKIKLSVELITK